MIVIDPTKPKTFGFKFDISGSNSMPESVRFFIKMLDSTYRVFEAAVSQGEALFQLPALSKDYRDMSVDARLEMIIDSAVYVPWQGAIEFKEAPQVKNISMFGESTSTGIKNFQFIEEKTEPPKVTVVESTPVAPKKEEKKIEEVKKTVVKEKPIKESNKNTLVGQLKQSLKEFKKN
jgi:hypothetical protein